MNYEAEKHAPRAIPEISTEAPIMSQEIPSETLCTSGQVTMSKSSRSLQGSRTRSTRIREKVCQAYDGNVGDDKDREEWISCRNCEVSFHLKYMNLKHF